MLAIINELLWLTGLTVSLIFLFRLVVGVVRAWSLVEFLWIHATLQKRLVPAHLVVLSFFLVLKEMLTDGPSTWTTQDGCYWSDWNDWSLSPKEAPCEP